MKIDPKTLQDMFDYCGVNKDCLYESLQQMGRKHLISDCRPFWSPENPSYGYCYVVSEMVYWYIAPTGTIPYKIRVPGDPGLHRFLKWPSGKIVDLTAEQFDNYEEVDYNAAKVCYFMQTGGKGPSKRARMLAQIMGISRGS